MVDARGGEALARVEILLDSGAYRTTTSDNGTFRLVGVAPGDYVLNVSTVGYHLVKKSFHLEPGGKLDFEIVLSPDTFHQTDSVEVQASPFDTSHPDSPSALVLAGNDVKNLASVLADDPLRSVQSLPGVTSNNDFDARFSLRGASFNQIGFYVDGVLLHEPFHMIQGQSLTGSGTSINGDMVEAMELTESAFPARFADRTGAVLDVTTRDGSLTGINFRLSASVSNAGLVAEGPFGSKKHRGSWLTVMRKSYLQYILARTFPDNTFIFGLEDVQTRLSYDPTAKSTNPSLHRELLRFEPARRQRTGYQFHPDRRLQLHVRQPGLPLLAQHPSAIGYPCSLDAREIRKPQSQQPADCGRVLWRVGVELQRHLDVE